MFGYDNIAQVVKQLTRIANALEAANDFSKEDATVRGMTKDIQKAEQNIPPRPTTKGTT